MKMTPLTNIQMAVKNNIDVLYFNAPVPVEVLFAEDGQMGEFNSGNYAEQRPRWISLAL